MIDKPGLSKVDAEVQINRKAKFQNCQVQGQRTFKGTAQSSKVTIKAHCNFILTILTVYLFLFSRMNILEESSAKLIKNDGMTEDGLASLKYRVVLKKAEALFTKYYIAYETPDQRPKAVGVLVAVFMALFYSSLALAFQLMRHFYYQVTAFLLEKLIIYLYFVVLYSFVFYCYY